MITYPFAFLTSVAIAISFRAPRSAILWSGLCGLAAWAGYDLSRQLGLPDPAAIFLGALVLGLLAEVLARRLHHPAILFAIPGLFPLVPGIIAYRGVLLLSQNRLAEGAWMLARALLFAGLLAAGLAIPPVLFRRWGGRHRHPR
ncbi:MAG: threonine/serine exporter family protein [Symbiobacterium sp.]|mgnify:CR=1 FL=1|uniref:threonine/serine exporter family protein n=1 Tax=Symbiobacterium sp. TaxID=1971213 RepID=UPI00346399E5